MVEGTSLLRKHTGLNLYRGFESLAHRQIFSREYLVAEWWMRTSELKTGSKAGIARAGRGVSNEAVLSGSER